MHISARSIPFHLPIAGETYRDLGATTSPPPTPDPTRSCEPYARLSRAHVQVLPGRQPVYPPLEAGDVQPPPGVLTE
jgi:hypothetical protein